MRGRAIATARGAALGLLLAAPALRADPLPRVRATAVQGPYESVAAYCADLRRRHPDNEQSCREALDELGLKPAAPTGPYRALSVLRVSGTEGPYGELVPAVRLGDGWYFVDGEGSRLSYDGSDREEVRLVGAEYLKGPAGAPLAQFRVAYSTLYAPAEKRSPSKSLEHDVRYSVGLLMLCGPADHGLACTTLFPVAGLDPRRDRPLNRWEQWDWRLSMTFPAAGTVDMGLAPGSTAPAHLVNERGGWIDDLPRSMRGELGRRRLPF